MEMAMCHLSLPRSKFPDVFFIRASITCIFISVLPVANALALDLNQAEQLAIASDPLIENLKATSRSFEEESFAADTLPDPKLRFGAVNVPVDGFDMKQENMTQLKLGIQQNFPAGEHGALLTSL